MRLHNNDTVDHFELKISRECAIDRIDRDQKSVSLISRDHSVLSNVLDFSGKKIGKDKAEYLATLQDSYDSDELMMTESPRQSI